MCDACVRVWTMHAIMQLQEPEDTGCPDLISFHLFLLRQGPSLIFCGGQSVEWSDS